jgi:hypothetical protein
MRKNVADIFTLIWYPSMWPQRVVIVFWNRNYFGINWFLIGIILKHFGTLLDILLKNSTGHCVMQWWKYSIVPWGPLYEDPYVVHITYNNMQGYGLCFYSFLGSIGQLVSLTGLCVVGNFWRMFFQYNECIFDPPRTR